MDRYDLSPRIPSRTTGARMHALAGTVALVVCGITACATPADTAESGPFALDEATISSIRAGVADGSTTCEAVVSSYLDRITLFDKSGELPVNSIIATNPRALDEARDIDRRAGSDELGPLACAPLIVKDNIDVAGMPTSAGSVALADSRPADDATQVERLRSAGAIVIAKSNLAEFAWTPDYTESSLGGLTRNPYDRARTTAGSSGGTAAAVAANFGVAGLGTDTGASIRGPSAHQNLVGLRPTMGASSRDGVLPIWFSRDTVGPMARTVSDAALMFEATAGYDSKDPATDSARYAPAFDAASTLSDRRLDGMRIGVLRQLSDAPGRNDEVAARFEEALADLREQGATIVDVTIPDLARIQSLDWPDRMEYDVNAYLQSLGPNAPVASFAEIVRSGKYVKEVRSFLDGQLNAPAPGDNPGLAAVESSAFALRQTLIAAMDTDFVSALVYPTWTQPPRLLADLNGNGGNNNSMAANAGLPAVTVPMGSTSGELPSGLQFTGRPFAEGLLLGAAYDYEQSTHHRTPPTTLPPAQITR